MLLAMPGRPPKLDLSSDIPSGRRARNILRFGGLEPDAFLVDDIAVARVGQPDPDVIGMVRIAFDRDGPRDRRCVALRDESRQVDRRDAG
jgi:hypothetical protein